MVRFNITNMSGGILDVSDPSGIAFKKENPFFRFAEVSLVRSTEFSAPMTEHNCKLLGVDKNAIPDGSLLYWLLPAQMQYDGGMQWGSLQFTGIDGDSFKFVFLVGNCNIEIGNSYWVTRLQDVKLSELSTGNIGKSLTIQWWGNSVTNSDNTKEVQMVQYDRLTSGGTVKPPVPCVNAYHYIKDILTGMGIPSAINTFLLNYWIVAGSLDGGAVDTVVVEYPEGGNLALTQSLGYLQAVQLTVEYGTVMLWENGVIGGGSNTYWGIKALRGVNITFPSNLTGVYVIKWNSKMTRYETLASSPLAGKSIDVPRGASIFFAGQPASPWGFSTLPAISSYSIVVQPNEEPLQEGDWWHFRGNEPDMTVYELLRSVALATGNELEVDAVNGVRIGPAAYDKTTAKDLNRVVSIESISRRVAAWGDGIGKAVIEFDSEDYVNDKIVSEYPLGANNLYITNQTKTAKVALSEGNPGNNGIAIEDFDFSGAAKFSAKRCTLAYAQNGDAYLQRVPTPDPVGLTDIAYNATCVKAKVAVELADFFDFMPYTLWLWRGSTLVWTDASWSDGIMDITLQLVSPPADVAPTPPPTPPELTGIVAVFTQGGATIYDTDTLDDLKQYLVVTANYDDGTSQVLSDNDYTLSGTLTVGTSTITVTYDGFTDTFTVVVSSQVPIEPTDNILTFVANTANSTVQLTAVGTAPSVTLSYMVDGLNWVAYNIGDTITLPYVGSWVKFKGTNARFGSSTSAYHQFVMTGSIASHGDATSLLNSTGGEHSGASSASYMFCYLFKDCTPLTTVPMVSVTGGGTSLLRGMFYGCSNIETAPEVLLTSIPNSGCRDMFNGCSRLNFVKIHATTIGSSGTASWLSNVAASGTIVCPSSLTLSSGVSGVPSGWTRVDL